MEYVPCIGNSSYSFWRILLKLYRCFKDGLKICILFFQNPEIIFYHFFRIFNLDIFRALILQICVWSIYLVSATPPTVFGESFWNFTVVFRMVWRYAYCFLRLLKLFFLSVRPSVRPCVSAHHHSCIGNSSYSFRPILLKLYRCFKDGLKICILFFQNPEIIFYHFFPIFNLDIFRALILQICIWSMYLVSATPPTVFGESFWNFTGVLRMVWRYAYCFFRILKLFFITFFPFLT